MSDEHDELTGIFDHLRPEDFTQGFGPNHGSEAFHKFVDANIITVRTGYAASDGHLNPFANLADSTSQVTITPTDDETLGEYVERCRSEAIRLGAKWVFIARKTLVGNYDAKSTDDIPDTSDPEALAKAIEEGLLVEGMFYYAERRELNEAESRHGIMKAQGNNLGECVEGSSAAQTVEFFKGILG